MGGVPGGWRCLGRGTRRGPERVPGGVMGGVPGGVTGGVPGGVMGGVPGIAFKGACGPKYTFPGEDACRKNMRNITEADLKAQPPSPRATARWLAGAWLLPSHQPVATMAGIGGEKSILWTSRFWALIWARPFAVLLGWMKRDWRVCVLNFGAVSVENLLKS